MMRDKLLLAGIAIAATVLIIGVIAIQVSIWNECRADNHSWLYCMRMISR